MYTPDQETKFIHAVLLSRGAGGAAVAAQIQEVPLEQARLWSFQWAAWRGDAEEVGRWVGMGCDIHANTSRALTWAISEDHLAVANFLLNAAVPQPQGAMVALVYAARRGCMALVDRLLPLSADGIFHDHNRALLEAIKAGHKEMVTKLIPVSTPRNAGSLALVTAAECGRRAVVDVLIPVSDVRAAWKELVVRREWKGLDVLSPNVPLSWVRRVLAGTPTWIRGQMPHATARLEEHDLKKAVCAAPPNGVKERIRVRL